MRNFLVFLGTIIFLFLLSSTTFSQTDPFLEDPVIKELVNLPSLKLDKSEELKDISEANKLLEEIQLIFEEIEKASKIEHHSIDIDSLYVEAIDNLVKLIQEYPDSKTALTAKLRLSYLVFLISYDIRVLNVAGKLFDEIIAEFPDAWQGKFALLGKATYLQAISKYTKSTVLINVHSQKIISLDNVQDPEFYWFKQKVLFTVSEEDKIDPVMRYTLIINYCVLEDFENAQKECEYILQNHPNVYYIDDVKYDLEMIKQYKSPHGVLKNGKVVYE